MADWDTIHNQLQQSVKTRLSGLEKLHVCCAAAKQGAAAPSALAHTLCLLLTGIRPGSIHHARADQQPAGRVRTATDRQQPQGAAAACTRYRPLSLLHADPAYACRMQVTKKTLEVWSIAVHQHDDLVSPYVNGLVPLVVSPAHSSSGRRVTVASAAASASSCKANTAAGCINRQPVLRPWPCTTAARHTCGHIHLPYYLLRYSRHTQPAHIPLPTKHTHLLLAAAAHYGTHPLPHPTHTG